MGPRELALLAINGVIDQGDCEVVVMMRSSSSSSSKGLVVKRIIVTSKDEMEEKLRSIGLGR